MRDMQDLGTFSRFVIAGIRYFRKVGASRIFLRSLWRRSEKKADAVRSFLFKRADCGRFRQLTLAQGISTMGGDGIPQGTKKASRIICRSVESLLGAAALACQTDGRHEAGGRRCKGWLE
jgi:hypothetical protein